MSRAIVLFTRDLRVRDQHALARAVREHDEVVPAFVLDERLLSASCAAANRVAFLLDCLADLERSLGERGAHLVVRRGDVVEEALRLVARWDARAIYLGADATPYARERERRLAATCRRERLALRVVPGSAVVPPGALVPAGGDHYRVFTPYWRVWRERAQTAGVHAPQRIAVPDGLAASVPPALARIARGHPSPRLARGGENEARRLLERLRRRGLARYATLRDDLAAAATSQLSAHLHFGCISAQAVLRRCAGQPGGEEIARQLCWRDFHHQVLAARPDMRHADYRPRRRPWRDDSEAAAAWRAGLTGVPIVDAGMRQLAQEGFMHNRARLVVASFLTKTLGLHWRIGAAHFAALLADADVASNVGNWQWVAGTGNDTRPGRVLNPLRQAGRHDPSGDYVRRHVPELSAIAGPAVQRPWLLAPRVRRGLRYPAPIAAACGR